MDWKRDSELNLEGVNNGSSNFILQRKNALQLTVVSFRPNLEASPRINQLSSNSNAVAIAAHASLQHVFHVQPFSNLARGGVRPFE